jgi:predicted DNA-binding transcriptional regulator AlpA
MAKKRDDAPAPLAVSISSAARMAGISRSMLYALIRAGEGPRTFKIGARTLIRVADLDLWLGRRAAA